MALPYKNVFDSLRTIIKIKRPDINTNIGSVVYDLFLTPNTIELTRMQVIIAFISILHSLNETLTAIDDEAFIEEVAEAFDVTTDEVLALMSNNITRLAGNFGVTKRSAKKATGTILFGTYTAPTSDIFVPAGTIIATSSGQEYTTLEDATLIASQSILYYDGSLNAYVLPVAVEATEAGTIGNTLENTITILSQNNPITGIDFVTNTAAITNGADEETDDELVERIKIVFTGTNLGTVDGYKRLLSENLGLTRVYVAGTGDPYQLRDPGFGGYVDIFLKDKDITTITKSIVYIDNVTEYVLPDQPVESVITVVAIVSGVEQILIEGTDYTFYKDTTALSGYSANAQSSIKFITLPDVGTDFTVVYTVDSNIVNAQEVFDLSENKIIGTNVLVRQGFPVDVDISFSITTHFGYAKSAVIAAVTNAITSFISTFDLGQPLQQSDLIAIVEAVEGVDRVVLPFNKFRKSSETTDTTDILEINANEYINMKTLEIS